MAGDIIDISKGVSEPVPMMETLPVGAAGSNCGAEYWMPNDEVGLGEMIKYPKLLCADTTPKARTR